MSSSPPAQRRERGASGALWPVLGSWHEMFCTLENSPDSHVSLGKPKQQEKQAALSEMLLVRLLHIVIILGLFENVSSSSFTTASRRQTLIMLQTYPDNNIQFQPGPKISRRSCTRNSGFHKIIMFWFIILATLICANVCFVDNNNKVCISVHQVKSSVPRETAYFRRTNRIMNF